MPSRIKVIVAFAKCANKEMFLLNTACNSTWFNHTKKKPTSKALVMAIIMAIILAIIHYLQGPDHGVGEDVGVVLAAEVQTIHLLVVPPLQIQNYVLQIHILKY